MVLSRESKAPITPNPPPRTRVDWEWRVHYHWRRRRSISAHAMGLWGLCASRIVQEGIRGRTTLTSPASSSPCLLLSSPRFSAQLHNLSKAFGFGFSFIFRRRLNTRSSVLAVLRFRIELRSSPASEVPSLSPNFYTNILIPSK